MTLYQTQQRAREIAQRKIDRRELSVKLLAAKSGYSTPHVSNWLHKDKDASVAALAAFLTALGLSLELLPTERGKE